MAADHTADRTVRKKRADRVTAITSPRTVPAYTPSLVDAGRPPLVRRGR